MFIILYIYVNFNLMSYNIQTTEKHILHYTQNLKKIQNKITTYLNCILILCLLHREFHRKFMFIKKNIWLKMY